MVYNLVEVPSSPHQLQYPTQTYSYHIRPLISPINIMARRSSTIASAPAISLSTRFVLLEFSMGIALIIIFVAY